MDQTIVVVSIPAGDPIRSGACHSVRHDTQDIRVFPGRAQLIHGTAERFLLQYGSEEIKAVIRDFPTFLGFQDLTGDGAAIVEYPRQVRPQLGDVFPVDCQWLGQGPDDWHASHQS